MTAATSNNSYYAAGFEVVVTVVGRVEVGPANYHYITAGALHPVYVPRRHPAVTQLHPPSIACISPRPDAKPLA